MSDKTDPLLFPEDLYEAGPVICRQCSRPLEPFLIEEIGGVRKLRCGSMLIPAIEGVCIHCGWTFEWHRERRAAEAKVATRFGEILQELRARRPLLFDP